MHSLSDTLVNWFPLLLLIGVWIFYMQRGGSSGPTISRGMAEQLTELRRQSEALERIARALEETRG